MLCYDFLCKHCLQNGLMVYTEGQKWETVNCASSVDIYNILFSL